jgi:hypothetical protein
MRTCIIVAFELGVFENRALRRMGWQLKGREIVTGESRKLHSEELHSLYSSPNIIMVTNTMIWAGHVARMD